MNDPCTARAAHAVQKDDFAGELPFGVAMAENHSKCNRRRGPLTQTYDGDMVAEAELTRPAGPCCGA